MQDISLDIGQALHYKAVMDKKTVTFRIDPAIIKRLKYLALEKDITLTELLLEAIQDLFKKYENKTKSRTSLPLSSPQR